MEIDLEAPDFSMLTVEQRLGLMHTLLESISSDIESETNAPMLTPEQQEELERRIAMVEAGEMEYESWDVVKARIFGKLT
jgi:putative addiction module component (TIGR02574 family)